MKNWLLFIEPSIAESKWRDDGTLVAAFRAALGVRFCWPSLYKAEFGDVTQNRSTVFVSLGTAGHHETVVAVDRPFCLMWLELITIEPI